MNKKIFDITINEGSAPDKHVIFECEEECREQMDTSEIITKAVANSVIQTKDVRWIESIKDVTNEHHE